MATSDSLKRSLAMLAAQACNLAIYQGKASKTQPLGVMTLRLVVGGETPEAVEQNLEAVRALTKAFGVSEAVKDAGVVESLAQGIVMQQVDLAEETVSQARQLMTQMLTATGMPSEMVDEALEWATEEMSKISEMRHDPMDVDEFLDMLRDDVTHPLLGD